MPCTPEEWQGGRGEPRRACQKGGVKGERKGRAVHAGGAVVREGGARGACQGGWSGGQSAVWPGHRP